MANEYGPRPQCRAIIQNPNRAVYSGWQASGGDGWANIQFASPPVATRNGLALPARIGALVGVANPSAPLAEPAYAPPAFPPQRTPISTERGQSPLNPAWSWFVNYRKVLV